MAPRISPACFGVDAGARQFRVGATGEQRDGRNGEQCRPETVESPPTDAFTADTTPPRWVGALDIMTVACGVCTIAPPTTVSVMTAATAAIGVSV